MHVNHIRRVSRQNNPSNCKSRAIELLFIKIMSVAEESRKEARGDPSGSILTQASQLQVVVDGAFQISPCSRTSLRIRSTVISQSDWIELQRKFKHCYR